MVRKYVRKTNRAKTDPDVVLQAIKQVKIEKKSMRSVSLSFNIPFRTLTRYCAKYSEEELLKVEQKLYKFGWLQNSKVFTDEQEKGFLDYLVTSSNIKFNLTAKEIRGLAYEYAKMHKISNNVLDSWSKNKMAGSDWYAAFIKRHSSTISLCMSETKNSNKVSDQNQKEIQLFYKNLEALSKQHNFDAPDIWIACDTSVSVVKKTNITISRKGTKKIVQTRPIECSVMVTVMIAASATGDIAPPFFVFPQNTFELDFLKDAPPGSHGCAHPSGSITEENDSEFLQHFFQTARPSKIKPKLLLLENRESCLSLEAINFATDNGICLLFIPPQCRERLQPLDNSLFEPFKSNVIEFCHKWNDENPGKIMTIFDIPKVVQQSLSVSVIPSTIQSGFETAGIFPCNECVFLESDFLPNLCVDTVISSESTDESFENEKDPLS